MEHTASPVEKKNPAPPDPLRGLRSLQEEAGSPPALADLLHGVEVLDFKTIFDLPPPAPDPIVANLFERGDKIELIGPSKVRKSWFGIGLAAHVAAGRPFCGWPVPKPRRVVYINLEIKTDWIARRLQSLSSYGLGPDEIGDRLKIVNARGKGGEIRTFLASLPARMPIDLIVVDPRYKLMEGDEDDNNAADLRALLEAFDHAAGNGPAILVVTHDGKGDAGARDIRDRGAGSSIASRDCDARIVLTPHVADPDNMLTVATLARNYPPTPSFSVVFDGETRTFRNVDDLPVAATAKEAKNADPRIERAILKLLEGDNREPTRELVAAVEEATGYKERKIKSVLYGMKRRGTLIAERGPNPFDPTVWRVCRAADNRPLPDPDPACSFIRDEDEDGGPCFKA